MDLSKCEKVLYFLCKGKKAPYSSFYEDKQFLDSSISAYFTLFESDFLWVIIVKSKLKTQNENSKVPLFMVASNTILNKHEIFNSKKETTKVAVLKL